LITVQQLEERASRIVGQPKKVLVPQYVLEAARSAINARSQYAEWFQRSFPTSSDGSREQIDGHLHFIDRLRVLVELLDFEDTPMQEETLVADARLPPRPGPNVTLDAKAKTSAASEQNEVCQYMFHFYCTIMDIHNIRRHVKTVWADYSQGMVDLFVASVITKMAFYLLLQLEEEDMSTTTFGPEMTLMIHARYIWTTVCSDFDVEDVYTKDHPPKAFAELLGIPAEQLVTEKFSGNVITDDVLNGILEKYDASFLIPAAQIAIDSVSSGHVGICYKIRDSLTKDLQDFDNALRAGRASLSSSIKLSTNFNHQILTDIHTILGPDVGKPAKRMRISLNLTKTYLESYG
jgi:hypothetical protein